MIGLGLAVAAVGQSEVPCLLVPIDSDSMPDGSEVQVVVCILEHRSAP